MAKQLLYEIVKNGEVILNKNLSLGKADRILKEMKEAFPGIKFEKRLQSTGLLYG